MDRYRDSDVKFYPHLGKKKKKGKVLCALHVKNERNAHGGANSGRHSMSLEGQKFQIKVLWEQQIVKYY